LLRRFDFTATGTAHAVNVSFPITNSSYYFRCMLKDAFVSACPVDPAPPAFCNSGTVVSPAVIVPTITCSADLVLYQTNCISSCPVGYGAFAYPANMCQLRSAVNVTTLFGAATTFNITANAAAIAMGAPGGCTSLIVIDPYTSTWCTCTSFVFHHMDSCDRNDLILFV
jgi:hypothetical protein